MKMKITYIYIIAAIILVFNSCGLTYIPDEDMPDGKIKFINNSSQSIFYLGTFYLIPKENQLIGSEKPANSTIDVHTIAPKNFTIENIYVEEFKDLLNTKYRTYFFFNKDSVKKHPWDTIVKRNLFLKQVTINDWQQLVDSNFTITYP